MLSGGWRNDKLNAQLVSHSLDPDPNITHMGES